MHNGNDEPSQLRKDNEITKKVAIPHKSFICSFMQWKVRKIPISCLAILLYTLQRVGEIMAIGEIKPRGC